MIPLKVEYSLTDVGKSLIPNIDGLVSWATDNFKYFVKK